MRHYAVLTVHIIHQISHICIKRYQKIHKRGKEVFSIRISEQGSHIHILGGNRLLVFASKLQLWVLRRAFIPFDRSRLARSVMSRWLTTCCGSSTWKGSPSTAWTTSLWRTLSGSSPATTPSVWVPASSSTHPSSSQDAGLLYARGRSNLPSKQSCPRRCNFYCDSRCTY